MIDAHAPHPAHDPRATGHEPDRVSFRAIWISIAAIALALLLTHLAIAAALRGPAERNPNPSGLESASFQASRDWGGPAREELAQLRERERANLESYEWLDPQRARARIPIHKAMEIIAERAHSGAAAPAPEPATASSPGGDQ